MPNTAISPRQPAPPRPDAAAFLGAVGAPVGLAQMSRALDASDQVDPGMAAALRATMLAPASRMSVYGRHAGGGVGPVGEGTGRTCDC